MAKPRLIAFEGVDGAGKTTVLSLVADALRQRGEKVFLPRSGKEHDSQPTKMIRRLTRDARNFDLTGVSELLLYCAREAQILDELVRPALARGETVLVDRSFLTPIVLAAFGRGVDRKLAESTANNACQGSWPDITLLFDVHPRTSRLRKRIEKVRTRPQTESGRKGQAGSGFKERIRDGYLQIGKEQNLPVFHAERVRPTDVAARVLAFLEHGTRPEQSESPDDSTPVWMVDPATSFEQALDLLPPEVALFLSNGLVAARALRSRLVEREPELVAWSMDVEDPLRDRLAESQPDYALRSWSKRPLSGKDDLRLRLLERAPDAAISALKHVHCEEADAIRERYADSQPSAVLSSLTGREDEFATRLRQRCWKDAEIGPRVSTLGFCTGPDAWKRREKLFEKVPHLALATLRGVNTPRANELLQYYASRTPKQVLSALTGRSDELSHQLRREVAHVGREVVDSVRGLNDEQSWQLRQEYAERYPSTVIHSLLGLPDSPRGDALRARCESIGAGDLHTARRAQQLDEYADLPDWTKARAALDGDD